MTTPSFSEPVSQTLLIPLWARAEESKRPDGLLKDPEAVRVVGLLSPATFDFPKKKPMLIGSVVRARHYDDLARQALAADGDKAVLVHLGCGLDDRFGRTDEGHGVQVNIDLPDVIDLRGRLMPSNNPRNIDWTGSIFEIDWMERLKESWPEGRFTFFMEGLMMYLDESGVQKFFKDLADRFPGATIHFDACDSRACKTVGSQKVIKQMKAEFKWALDDINILTRWHPALRHVKTDYYFDLFKKRWGLLRLIRFIPTFGKGSKMLTYSVMESAG